MSDKMEREYRQNMLTILIRFYRGRGGSLLTKDESEALDYAISSIKTDLKYDLLYEETKHIADADKMIESITKNDVPENNAENIYICSCGYGWDKSKVVRHHFCPNCGKAVEPTTKNDLGVKFILKSDVDRIINCPYFRQADKLIQIMNLPSVTPQEKKGHWIPVFQGDEIIEYRCSCCEFGNAFGKGTVGMNYCSRCGSRNEVEE